MLNSKDHRDKSITAVAMHCLL